MFTIGDYEVLPLTVRHIINSEASSWAVSATRRHREAPDEKTTSFPVVVHYLYMRHIKSGFVFRFTGAERKTGLKFTDGRHDVCDMGAKGHRLTQAELTAEVARMLGIDNASKVIQLVFAHTMKGSDAKDILKPWNDAIDAAASINRKSQGEGEERILPDPLGLHNDRTSPRRERGETMDDLIRLFIGFWAILIGGTAIYAVAAILIAVIAAALTVAIPLLIVAIILCIAHRAADALL